MRTLTAAAKVDGRVCVIVEPIALYHTRDLHPGDGAWMFLLLPQGEAIDIGEVGVYSPEARDLVIFSYGNGVPMSLRVAKKIAAEHGVHATVIDLRWLAPPPAEAIETYAREAASILVVDECRRSGNVGRRSQPSWPRTPPFAPSPSLASRARTRSFPADAGQPRPPAGRRSRTPPRRVRREDPRLGRRDDGDAAPVVKGSFRTRSLAVVTAAAVAFVVHCGADDATTKIECDFLSTGKACECRPGRETLGFCSERVPASRRCAAQRTGGRRRTITAGAISSSVCPSPAPASARGRRSAWRTPRARRSRSVRRRRGRAPLLRTSSATAGATCAPPTSAATARRTSTSAITSRRSPVRDGRAPGEDLRGVTPVSAFAAPRRRS